MPGPEDQLNLKERRLLLFSTRIRFAPQTQPIRETAIDKIVEQNLLLCDAAQTVREIERQCLDFKGQPVLPRNDIECALTRLVGRSVEILAPGEPQYRLTDARKSELWALQNLAESRFRDILNRLFRGVASGPTAYSASFLECLSIIFSELGEAYVRHLRNEINLSDFVAKAEINHAVGEALKKNRASHGPTLQNAVVRFFEENDPAFAELKWNLAQNYYVAKALGLDPSGKLLSQEIFGDAVFYIDTNVLVHSLDPTGRHHKSFHSLIRSCKQLGIEIHATQISIDELRRVAAMEKDLISKRVPEKIPADTIPKVRGILLPAYLEEIRTKGSCDIEKLFERFDRPSTTLTSMYGIEVIDDQWFVSAETAPETQAWAEQVKQAYKERSKRKKGDRASIHDALMIRWVEKERLERELNTWFITLDTSLPGFRHKMADQSRPYAMSLVGLMQWLSPVATSEDELTAAADIFSEALRQQLLPRENFFELRDFLIFSEMEMSTALLPARDVEECIRAIKAKSPDLNPTNAADREKLAHEIARFFVDPGRQYQTNLQEQSATIKKLANEKVEVEKQAVEEIDSLREKLSTQAAAFAELKSSAQMHTLRLEAKLRLTGLGLLLLAGEAVLFYCANKYLEGPNFLQRTMKGWSLFLGFFTVIVSCSWFIVGKKRLTALGWPFTKIFKIEEEGESSNSES